MFFSRKKKLQISNNAPTTTGMSGSDTLEDKELLKQITQNLYKQNVELATKNKIFSLLRKMYQISLMPIGPESLGEKLTQAIQSSFEFDLVGVLMFNTTVTTLNPLSFAFSDRLKQLESTLNFSFNCEITGLDKNNFFSTLITHKAEYNVDGVGDIWKNCFPEKISSALLEDIHIKTSIGYPLIVNEKFIGVLIVCSNRQYESLAQYEQDALFGFVDLVAIALDKAFLYKELQIANRKLEVVNEQQIGLLHFITHQVKGFLTKSKYIFSEIIEGDYGAVSDGVLKMAREGLSSSTKGVITVQDILNAANIKRGTMKFDKKAFNADALVLNVIKEQEKYIKAKGLELKKTILKTPITIHGDEGQIKHVFLNLLDNSIKYTSTGTIYISLEKQPDGKILFSIQDTGVGLTASDKGRLFTEGGKGKLSQKTNVDSTGYGLFIAKGIVDGHHGRIWAESEGEGKGSQFYVELPSVG